MGSPSVRALLPGLLALSIALPTADARAVLPGAADRNGDGRVVLACLGDSNTDSRWQFKRPGGFPQGAGWCEQLANLLGVEAINLGTPGASAVPSPFPDVPDQRIFFSGIGQLDYLLRSACPDVVVMAFGTNDVLESYGADPERIAEVHRELVARAQAAGALVLVATAPRPQPVPKRKFYRRSREATARVNELLRAAFPADILLDFEARLAPEDFLDDLHMNGQGQHERALEAQRKLAAALARGPFLPPAPELRWRDDVACRVCRKPE